MTDNTGDTSLPKPDDPDLGHDQPQGPYADESTNKDFDERYGGSEHGAS